MKKRKRDRLFWRDDREGWYADFRDFADVGGGKEAMRPDAKSPATQDRDEAANLCAARLEVLKAKRLGVATPQATSLLEFSNRHLELKGTIREASTVERDRRALDRLIPWFAGVLGKPTVAVTLEDVTVRLLNDYVRDRRQQPGKQEGTTIAAQTIRNELHSLSNLFAAAVAEDLVPANPVSRMTTKPRVVRGEAVWLEIGEAARLLQVAQTFDAEPPKRGAPPIRFLAPLIATYLLTGARRTEVFGLEVEDLDPTNDAIHIRRNVWRKLKRPWHERWVPYFPQLRAILEAYLETSGRTTGLVFPAPSGGMLTDIRSSLHKAQDAAEITKHLTPKVFRHTYTAARLQTTDHGAPISPYTVMRELGHRTISLIEGTYGHLMHTRHRTPHVVYTETKVLEIGGRSA